MSFSIIRMQKMKSTAIKGIQFHNQRERESETNPDINKEDSHLNYDLINGQKQIDYNEKINQVIEENVTTNKAIRKDAVRLAEFLITSDKEFFENISPKEQERFFETAHGFLADRYGEKNLIYATVHLDEKTPHMHVGFVPVTEDGRLSAKDYFGQKSKLVSLQDGFNQYLKDNGFELERGVSSSRKHLETGKFKALTFQDMERQAQEKYEQTMSHIHEIDDKTKSIEDIEAKKVLGLVGMKEKDYQSLVDYATSGVGYRIQAENLQKELEKAEKEVVQLKSEIQTSQDKVRDYYKDVQEENKKLKEDIDILAEKKAEAYQEKAEDAQKEVKQLKLDMKANEAKIRNHYQDIQAENKHLKENMDDLAEQKARAKVQSFGVVKKYTDLIEKYNGLVEKHRQFKESANQTFLDLRGKIENLTSQNRSYEDENRELKSENETLKEKVLKIGKELADLKERLPEILNFQLSRIKTWLNIERVDREKIKFLDERREKFIEGSLKELEKPKKEKERELEHEIGG